MVDMSGDNLDREYHNRKAKESRERRRALINELKSEPCSICGASYPPYVMDFHHVDPASKEIAIGKKVTWKLDKLLREIEKCVLLCANCHRQVEHGDLEVPKQ